MRLVISGAVFLLAFMPAMAQETFGFLCPPPAKRSACRRGTGRTRAFSHSGYSIHHCQSG